MTMAYQHDEAREAAPAQTGAPEEDVIEALAHAETSPPITLRDLTHLAVLGLAVPAALLVWGWS